MSRYSTSTIALPSQSLLALCSCLAFLSFATGCGGSYAPPRAAVSGKITLDGEPLSQGTITFVPLGEGVAASGEIANGQFSIDAGKGPSPGKCRVEVLSFQETGEKVPGISDDASGMTAETKQVIPKEFNTESTLEERVDAKGENVFELTLTSR